jgi:hypothetical protein
MKQQGSVYFNFGYAELMYLTTKGFVVVTTNPNNHRATNIN